MYRLSKESGLHIKTVCNMFSRNSMPSIPTLEAICKAFGISVSQFFSDSELTKIPPALQEIIDKWPTLNDTQRAAFSDLLHSIEAQNN